MQFDSLLFLDHPGSARSTIAEALARAVFADAVSVTSVSSEPAAVDPDVATVLAELGVDLPAVASRTVSADSVDLVVALYHLGVDVGSREAVVDAHRRAVAAGWTLRRPARTTWRGTPLHELWLEDPGGNLVEIYARLTPVELAEMPADMQEVVLVEP